MEDIQAWLALPQAERYHEAWLALVRDNPLPAVHERVCYHPCESSCNRLEIDGAVSIHAVERFLGDLAAREGWTFPKNAPASMTRADVRDARCQARHGGGTRRHRAKRRLSLVTGDDTERRAQPYLPAWRGTLRRTRS